MLVVAICAVIGGIGTPSSLAASTPTYAFVGNSFSAGIADSVPHSILALAASPDGVAMSGSSWEEYNHDARVFDPINGHVLGPYTLTRNEGGIYAVAIDATYVYYADGAGKLWRGARSYWMDPLNVTSEDTGGLSGDASLTVDAGGHQLMGLAKCANQLFVSDPNGPLGASGNVSPNGTLVKAIPTSLSGVTTAWSVPRARSIACDREGDIWVLQQGVSGGSPPSVERFTPWGRLLSWFVFPSGVYPTGLAASPTSDTIVVPDNGSGQNFKKFSYAGTQTGQIGVTGGYLAGPTPGVIASNRFAGPRAIAFDSAGDVFTAESGNPGQGQNVWSDYGPLAIITKFKSDASTVVYRDYATAFGVGEPTVDGTAFFDRHMEYRRDTSGKYQPYAYTVDPWTNPGDNRLGTDHDWWALSTRTYDADGHRYINVTDDPNPFTIFEQRPSSHILKPVVTFDDNSTITTDGTSVNVASNPALANRQGSQDWWTDAAGNVWSVGGQNQIWEYKLRGYATDGTPRYDFNHVGVFPFPPQLNDVRRIEVDGNTVYLSGFSGSEIPDADWDGWKSMGRHLLKFSRLPTSAGWPEPAWEHDFSYGRGVSPSNDPVATGYPTGFASDGSIMAVAWLKDAQSTAQGQILELNDPTGSVIRTVSPPAPPLGQVGWLDIERPITARNGWIWAEDDWQAKSYGICPSGSCK